MSQKKFAMWYLILNTPAVPQKGLFSSHSIVQSTDARMSNTIKPTDIHRALMFNVPLGLIMYLMYH